MYSIHCLYCMSYVSHVLRIALNVYIIFIICIESKTTEMRYGFVTFFSKELCLPPMVVYYRRSSFTKGHLPPKVVFHRKSSSTKGRPPLKVVFHWSSSSTYHSTFADLIFVSTLNIPNLSLLPCLEVTQMKILDTRMERTHKATYWCRFAAQKCFCSFLGVKAPLVLVRVSN